MKKVKGFGFTGIAALAFLFAFQGAVHGQAKQKASKSTAKTAADKSTSQPPPDAQYLGSETCKTCHEDIYNGWEKTPHWKTTLDTKGGPSHQGCEGCHGPGAAHVAGGGDITKIFTFKDASTKEINDRCMTCHAGGDQHMNALNSVHTKNDVSCISCHSPHHAETRQYLLVKAQPELCYTLPPRSKKPQFDMPFHHRVNEGLDPMHRLPQRARVGAAQTGAHVLDAGRGLLQVPHRQAGSVCLRACADEGGRLRIVPHGSWRAESRTC